MSVSRKSNKQNMLITATASQKNTLRVLEVFGSALSFKPEEQQLNAFLSFIHSFSSFLPSFSMPFWTDMFSIGLRSPECSSTLIGPTRVFTLPSSRCHLHLCPQLLDLFMVWDWSTYLADYGQPSSKYLRVNPATALALLEKWVPVSLIICDAMQGHEIAQHALNDPSRLDIKLAMCSLRRLTIWIRV